MFVAVPTFHPITALPLELTSTSGEPPFARSSIGPSDPPAERVRSRTSPPLLHVMSASPVELTATDGRPKPLESGGAIVCTGPSAPVGENARACTVYCPPSNVVHAHTVWPFPPTATTPLSEPGAARVRMS